MKRKINVQITDEQGVKSGFEVVTVLTDLDIMDVIALKYTEPSKCKCQGFYVPIDCPIHGRNK